MPATRHDLIIIGGGLAGGLAALAVAQRRPEVDILLVEPGERLGGNHLWSFFESDVDPGDRWLVDELIGHRWPAYDVRFPSFRRRIDEPYRTIESEALDRAVRSRLAPDSIVRASALEIAGDEVRLSDGRTLSASAVLDMSGLSGPQPGLACGWQKFVGQLLSIEGGHGLKNPLVMDATVDQADGYRFVYALPFSSTKVFVEDTYYSEHPELDEGALEGRIAGYAKAQGWIVTDIARQEQGILPVLTGGDFDSFWPVGDGGARGGVRAALFHHLTSYSLPDAVRFASWLAGSAPLDSSLGAATRARVKAHWRQGAFDRLLARMLFRAADPPVRYRVLERFYRLPAPLISRFYAGRSTWADRLRIVAGRPPVPIGRALSAVRKAA